MNEHFAAIAKQLIPISQNITADANYKKFSGKRNVSSIFLQPTDECKFIEIISRLNNYKSLGYRDIPITLIKEAKFIVARYIAHSYNDCLAKGI